MGFYLLCLDCGTTSFLPQKLRTVVFINKEKANKTSAAKVVFFYHHLHCLPGTFKTSTIDHKIKNTANIKLKGTYLP